MFHLDFQRIKVAIQSGRLDEAVARLKKPQLREHRTGQKLLDRLVDELLRRSEEHLSADRLDAAAQDVGNARQLAGDKAEVADLASRVDARIAKRRQLQDHRQRQERLADERIRAGALTMGARLASELDDQVAANRINDQLQRQQVQLADQLGQIQASLQQGDHEAAVALYADLPGHHQRRPEVWDLVGQAADSLIEEARSALRSGRLDRLAAVESQLEAIERRSPQAGDLLRALKSCRSLRRSVDARDYHLAGQELGRLQHYADAGDWLKATAVSIQQLGEHLAAIESGPLGLIDERAVTRVPPRSSRPLPTADVAGDGQRCLLQVDGLGSLLLLSQASVVVGGSGHRSSADLRLLTDGVAAPLMLRRDGDDYLASSDESFQVNGRAVQRQLLSSGDSIELGRRGRLRFQRPVAASGSAVLELTAAGLSRGDIRKVVLMADSLLFGPRGTHFPLESMQTPVVLSLIDGQFAIRRLAPPPSGEVASGGSARSITPLGIGQPVEIDGTRFSLCPFPAGSRC